MEGSIDSTFMTQQRDLFASGLVAEIGVNAFAVWSVIKFHADFSTGEAHPGMRSIAKKIGVSQQTVMRAVEALQTAHMLRIVADAKFKRKGQTYIARERLAVRLGNRVLCTVVIDYVPANLRSKINSISQSLKSGEHDTDAWAEVEIIPGDGFVWIEQTKTLRASVLASEIPFSHSPTNESDAYHQKLTEDLLARIAPNITKRMLVNK